MNNKRTAKKIFAWLLPFFKFYLPSGKLLLLGEQLNWEKQPSEPAFELKTASPRLLPPENFQLICWFFPELTELQQKLPRLKEHLTPGGYLLVLLAEENSLFFTLREQFLTFSSPANLLSFSFSFKGRDFLLLGGKRE